MQIGEVLYPQFPPNFRMPRQRARTGAGNVNQNAIEPQFEWQWSRAVEHASLDVSNARLGEAFPHGADPMPMKIRGGDAPIRSDRPGKQQCFSARRSAKIENAMPGLSLNEVRHRLGSFILNHDPAIAHRFASRGIASLKGPRRTQQTAWLHSAAGMLKGPHRFLVEGRVEHVPR